MKRFLNITLVCVAILAISASVFAQGGRQGGRGEGGERQGGRQGQPGGPGGGGPGGPGGFGGGMMMGGEFRVFMNPDAAKELNITEDQATKIREALRPGTPPAQGERPDFEKMRKEAMEKVEKIVSAEQWKKAQVLSFQSMGGLDGWPRPEGADEGRGPGGGPGGPGFNASTSEFALGALGLTDAQKKIFADAQTKQREAMRSAFTGDRENVREAIEKAQAEFKKAIDGMLTNDQKAQAKKLVDEAPDFVKPQARQPREGGRERGEGARERGEGYRGDNSNWRPGQNNRGENRREPRGTFPTE